MSTRVDLANAVLVAAHEAAGASEYFDEHPSAGASMEADYRYDLYVEALGAYVTAVHEASLTALYRVQVLVAQWRGQDTNGLCPSARAILGQLHDVLVGA